MYTYTFSLNIRQLAHNMFKHEVVCLICQAAIVRFRDLNFCTMMKPKGLMFNSNVTNTLSDNLSDMSDDLLSSTKIRRFERVRSDLNLLRTDLNRFRLSLPLSNETVRGKVHGIQLSCRVSAAVSVDCTSSQSSLRVSIKNPSAALFLHNHSAAKFLPHICPCAGPSSRLLRRFRSHLTRSLR